MVTGSGWLVTTDGMPVTTLRELTWEVYDVKPLVCKNRVVSRVLVDVFRCYCCWYSERENAMDLDNMEYLS